MNSVHKLREKFLSGEISKVDYIPEIAFLEYTSTITACDKDFGTDAPDWSKC
jgi:hypothetical protein